MSRGKNVRRVAVIGAGVSGVVTAKWLKSEGIEVVVYERAGKVGGNWSVQISDSHRSEGINIITNGRLFNPLSAPEPPYPQESPTPPPLEIRKLLKLQNGEEQKASEIELLFAPPGPAYENLKNNIPTSMQELKGHPWPEGTGDWVTSVEKQKYIESYSEKFDVKGLIRFHTSVENVVKEGDKWIVESVSLIKRGEGEWEVISNVDKFDAVVVASGHYHAIRVPDIPGLKEWKSLWPDKVQHSKAYRRPVGFDGQNVLLIGAGVSAMDIGREIAPSANKIYQSTRGGEYDLPVTYLDPSIERVSEVSSFAIPHLDSSDFPQSGTVTLKDGRKLENIDRVILCTGYHQSRPFLPQFQNHNISVEKADDKVLVTDGTQMHNLHKDIFYIPDPTLAFVGIPYYTATFVFFEYLAIAVAGVFSGKVDLPTESEMRDEYEKRVLLKGYGRNFHSMKQDEVQYVDELVDWINRDIVERGGARVERLSEKWLDSRSERVRLLKEVAEGIRPVEALRCFT
ncbi:hypothetical protein HYFRA_00002300 [Hymenoscyphus fraxineus]|uniref:FAD dependent oxidoreductase n=1 Tax=Hymenoscyphus fraxineus TaxID=746836 RepID=A0A9N9LA61_9HELO|nr:hypothetical protein HYFRA_00002300 [Hymenoscyphus fraxineus]